MAASCLMTSCMMPVAAAPAKAPVSLKAAPAVARLPAVSNRTIKKTSCMQARPCRLLACNHPACVGSRIAFFIKRRPRKLPKAAALHVW